MAIQGKLASLCKVKELRIVMQINIWFFRFYPEDTKLNSSLKRVGVIANAKFTR